MVSYLHVPLLSYRLRMCIRFRSSLLLMVQFKKEQSVETFNIEPNFLSLWASQFTRLLGSLSFRTCKCSQKKKSVSSQFVHQYLLFTGEYWREKERLDVSISQAMKAVQIFGVNLHSLGLVTVGKVSNCLLCLFMSPWAWTLCSRIQALGQTDTCLLTAQAGLW